MKGLGEGVGLCLHGFCRRAQRSWSRRSQDLEGPPRSWCHQDKDRNRGERWDMRPDAHVHAERRSDAIRR